MTDHTYAGYTAEQIRAKAVEATPSSEWQFEHRNVEIKFRVRSGIQAFFPLSRCHNVLNAEVRANVAHIEMCQPTTVLALLDRIAELEQQQRQMANDMTVIQRIHGEQKAELYGRIAELEPDAARWSAIISGDLEGLTLFAHNADWTTLDPLVGSTADAAIDAARAEQKNPAAP